MKAIDQLQAPAVAAINGRFQNIPITVTAGPHKVGVTFIARSYAESDEVLYSFKPGAGEERIPRVGSVEVVGPFNPAGIERHAEPEPDFRVPPRAANGTRLPCATKILSTFARRAFRRPVTDQRSRRRRSASTRAARATADFDTGIRDGLTAILASPKFLFRAERLPDNVAPGAVYRISDLDLASRLSFFLSAGLPDDELLDVGREGQAARRQGARGAGAAAAGRSQIEVAGHQFRVPVAEGARRSTTSIRTRSSFPNFDDGLRDAFRSEMELFVDSILREDRSVLDLLTADHTFVNERLALHYGIPERARRSVPPRDARRSESLGAARQRQRADGDVVRQPHGAGAARRLDPGEHHRHAAGGAAAGRRGVQGKQGRREGHVGARDHGAAPRQAVLQCLPRRHGSARLRARELRRDRRVASEGSRTRARRSMRPASWWTARR